MGRNSLFICCIQRRGLRFDNKYNPTFQTLLRIILGCIFQWSFSSFYSFIDLELLNSTVISVILICFIIGMLEYIIIFTVWLGIMKNMFEWIISFNIGILVICVVCVSVQTVQWKLSWCRWPLSHACQHCRQGEYKGQGHCWGSVYGTVGGHRSWTFWISAQKIQSKQYITGRIWKLRLKISLILKSLPFSHSVFLLCWNIYFINHNKTHTLQSFLYILNIVHMSEMLKLSCYCCHPWQ